MINSQHHVESAILAAWPAVKWSNMTIVVACSGGADSTALVRALCNVKPMSTTIKIAHFNHQLRGKDSDADELFVVELGQRLNCECKVQCADKFGLTSNDQLALAASEDHLRDVRYQFLQSYANEVGARYIVTAHTADDQAETIIHRLCRGSGLLGLAGIPRFRSTGGELIVARPMLSIWRLQIIEYLTSLGQKYRNDLSNQGSLYTRNRIRNEVLPQLESLIHPNARQNLVDTGEFIAELLEYFQAQANSFLHDHVKLTSNEVHFELQPFMTLGETLGKEVLRAVWTRTGWPMKDMAREHWQRLYVAIASDKDTRTQQETDFPGRIRVSKVADRVTIRRLES